MAAEPKRRGRPSLGDDANTKAVTIRLSPSIIARINAVRGQRTMSEFVRVAALAEIERDATNG